MVWIVSIVVLALVLLLAIWFLQRFFAKATLDTALVRTGFGGAVVVVDGGCLALPILHQVQKVSMVSQSFLAARKGRNALLTRDQMRADVEFEFELRVAPTDAGISTAAQALGHRISRSGDAMQEVMSGSLIDAIQNAAATRTLDEIHLDRAGFTADVAAAVEVQAAKLGLTLVSASLVSVDQSDLSQMNENNAFNARGMRQLAELVAEQRKARVQIETEAEIAVRESRLAQHTRQIELQQTERAAEIANQEHLAKLEADAKSREEQARAEAHLASETSRIENDQRAKSAQVASDETLRRTEMAAILALEESRIANDIQLALRRAEEATAKATEEKARAQVLVAAEQVQAQKEHAAADRERQTARLKQQKDLELEDARVKSEVATLLARAKADAVAAATGAEVEQIRMEAMAAGQAALNAAENTLSDAVIAMRLEERKLDRMPEIMTQMMKPVEKIDSIRINQIAGLGNGGSGDGSGGGTGGIDGAFGAAMDQILGMAVRLPAMKQMGAEIGLDFDANLAGRTADYANRIKEKTKTNPTGEKT